MVSSRAENKPTAAHHIQVHGAASVYFGNSYLCIYPSPDENLKTSAWLNPSELLLLFSAMASGEVDVQTHLSPAVPLTQTGQFTYQAEQKMQCLSVTLFLSLLDENRFHSMRVMDHRCGRGTLSLQRRRRWRD